MKLTSKARSKLPSSVFAGPNRSYPIPDKAHARAAEMLINKGSLSGPQKKRVLAKARGMLDKVK